MIRCTQCGYKNSPVYHYCGVCGAVLHPATKEEAPTRPAAPAPPVVPASVPSHSPSAPAAVPPPAPSVSAPVSSRSSRSELPVTSGMSFLGLSDAPGGGSSSYLLDDEEDAERSVAWGRILLVLVLLGAAGGLGWQYYRGAYPFAPRGAAPTASSPAASSPSPATEPTTQAPSPASAAPAPAPSTETPPAQTASAPATTPSAPAAANENPAPAEAKTEQAEQPPSATGTPPAAEKPEVAKVEKTPPVRTEAPAPAPEPAVPPGESLFVQGQRYLYGTGGVPANCDLALKSLLAAASRSHTRAQSTLGTMYSTGHCVTRDLPSAYKWFAKALHSEPSNTRLEEDLNVVWRQMTPGERQLATKND
jgi:hypothetical protein